MLLGLSTSTNPHYTCKLKHNPYFIKMSYPYELLTKAVIFEMLTFGKMWSNLYFMAIQPPIVWCSRDTITGDRDLNIAGTFKNKSFSCFLKSTWPCRSNPNSHPCFCQRFSSARKGSVLRTTKRASETMNLSVCAVSGYFLTPPVTLEPTHSIWQCTEREPISY